MRYSIFKKSNGDATFTSGLIVTFTLIVTLFICIMLIQNVSRNSDIKSACRGYLYTMETKGYLTQENMDALKTDLEALGVKNISFDGTTIEKASYGSVITLKVTFDTPVFSFNFNNTKGTWAYTKISITRHTVAKH